MPNPHGQPSSYKSYWKAKTSIRPSYNKTHIRHPWQCEKKEPKHQNPHKMGTRTSGHRREWEGRSSSKARRKQWPSLMGKTSFQNHEISAISTDTERNRQTMDERMENRKGRRQKASQYTQNTTHRNRNQTLSKHQKSKTYSMDSETVDGTLFVE